MDNSAPPSGKWLLSQARAPAVGFAIKPPRSKPKGAHALLVRRENVSSWITADVTKCYQVMECDDRPLLNEWMAACRDLIDFEVVSVITSAEAAEGVAPRL